MVCAVAFVLFAACAPSAPRSSGQAADDRETQSLLGLKRSYAAVVSGVDVRGTTAMVYVDVNQLHQLDETSETSFKAIALKQFENVWKRNHRGAHGKLSVALRDFTGAEVATVYGKV